MPRGRKIAAVVAGEARLVEAPSSPAILPEGSPLRRRPRAPARGRPPEFPARFESRVLFYDAFWHADGQRILLVGPPPLNLGWEFLTARYVALPLDYWLGERFHESASVGVVELYDVPRGTREVVARIGGTDHVMPVGRSFTHEFAGRNVLTGVSCDHDLDWICEWARYHVRRQGVDAVVLFDTGSPRYGAGEIEQCLMAVLGLERVAVLSWPFAYGARDPAVLFNKDYPLFLANCALSVALRRFAAQARGLLNCPLDELVETPAGITVFDLLARTGNGLLAIPGEHNEAAPAPEAPPAGRTQRHFPYVHKDAARRRAREHRWVMDPSRPWVAQLGVHPCLGQVHGRPPFSRSFIEGARYRRFRGIGAPPPAQELERDSGFDALFADIQ